MELTRRSFVTKVVVGIAGLPFIMDLSSAQTRRKLGYMKIVDTASMFMAVEKDFLKWKASIWNLFPWQAARLSYKVSPPVLCR